MDVGVQLTGRECEAGLEGWEERMEGGGGGTTEGWWG